MPFRPRTIDGLDLPADYSVTQHGPTEYRLFTADFQTHTFRTAEEAARFAWTHVAGETDATDAVISSALTLVKSNAPAKVKPDAAPALHAYSIDDGGMVPVSPEQKGRFDLLHRHVQLATLVQAAALREIADDKLYLAAGCSSFTQYVEAMLPDVSLTAAKRYVKIGRAFAPMLPSLGEGEAVSDEANEISTLGFTKLLGMARADDDTRAELVEEQQLTAADGTVYTLDELKRMRSKEYNALLSEVQAERKAVRSRTAQLEEEIKLLKSERDSDAERIDEANEKLEAALELERLHGDAELSYQQQAAALTKAREAVKAARRYVMTSGVTGSSATAHVNDAVDLLRELLHLGADASEQFGYLVTLADAKYRTHTNPTVAEALDRLEGEVVA